MHCVICNAVARYNRAVVECGTGDVWGGLCSACERWAFGCLVEQSEDASSERCDYCESPTAIVLPEHHIKLGTVAGVDVESEGYPITPESPQLCWEHAEQLLRVGEPEVNLEPVPGGVG